MVEARIEVAFDDAVQTLLGLKEGFAIVSDGTSENTHLLDLSTGKTVEGVTRLEWKCTAPGIADAVICIRRVPLIAAADKLEES